MSVGRGNASGGFTLFELVLTLVLVGFLSAMVVPFFLAGVTKGAEPLAEMPTPLAVQSIMARIAADYASNGTYLNNLAQLSASIVSGRYGLTASHTILKDPAFRFDAADTLTALKVTIRDNASGQQATMVFTRQQ